MGAPIKGQELTVLRLRGGGGTGNSDDGASEGGTGNSDDGSSEGGTGNSDDGASVSHCTSNDDWNDFLCATSKPVVRGRNV